MLKLPYKIILKKGKEVYITDESSALLVPDEIWRVIEFDELNEDDWRKLNEGLSTKDTIESISNYEI